VFQRKVRSPGGVGARDFAEGEKRFRGKEKLCNSPAEEIRKPVQGNVLGGGEGSEEPLSTQGEI